MSVEVGSLGREKKKKKKGPVRGGPETSTSGPEFQDFDAQTDYVSL
jgi:hypothetical protein